MPSRFAQRLADGPPVVADGGMGALIAAAVPRLRTAEEANLRAPEVVVSLHVGFINAGAELIETNTFGANRRKLAHHFLEDEAERINSAAVKLAREAREIAGRDVFIGGSIGPLGEAASSRVRRELFAACRRCRSSHCSASTTALRRSPE
jgi:methionine synthase I (cobalamin-dependent)